MPSIRGDLYRRLGRSVVFSVLNISRFFHFKHFQAVILKDL